MKRVDTLLLDVDDTLYSSETGFAQRVSLRVAEFIKLLEPNLTIEEAVDIRKRHHSRCGATLPVLMQEYGVCPDKYAEFVCDIDYTQYIKYNQALYDMLTQLPQRKIIFTNASGIHARKIMDILNINHLIDKVIAIEDIRYISKPQPQAFREMILKTGIAPTRTLFFDDQPDNIKTAQKFGIKTALINKISSTSDLTLDKLTDLDINLLI